MAQADPSLSDIRSRITQGSFILAMQRARGMVKDQLKRERIRLADVEAREITVRAREYLDKHPELVTEAKPVIEAWFARGVFGKRAQKEFIKHSGIEQSQGERSVGNG